MAQSQKGPMDDHEELAPIVMYRSHLLPISETFVLTTGEHLKRYRTHYLGMRLVEGLRPPADRTVLVRDLSRWGHVDELNFRIRGRSVGVARLLRSLRPKLVHAHFGPDGFRVAREVTRSGVPLIVTLHGYDVTINEDAASPHPGYAVYRRNLQRLARSTAAFVAVSEYIKGEAVARGLPQDRVHVVYNGVDVRNTPTRNAPPDAPLILFVGRLIPNKGLDHLLAAAGCSPELRATRLVVVGDGPDRARSEMLAHSLDLNVEFVGKLAHDEVRRWMTQASVVCIPSVTATTGASEGLPIVLLEAQAAGVPVVAYATGGIPEGLVPGESGILVDEGDREALSAALQTIVARPAENAEMGRRGRKHVEARFSVDRHVDAIEAVYTRVIGAHPGFRTNA